MRQVYKDTLFVKSYLIIHFEKQRERNMKLPYVKLYVVQDSNCRVLPLTITPITVEIGYMHFKLYLEVTMKQIFD